MVQVALLCGLRGTVVVVWSQRNCCGCVVLEELLWWCISGTVVVVWYQWNCCGCVVSEELLWSCGLSGTVVVVWSQ